MNGKNQSEALDSPKEKQGGSSPVTRLIGLLGPRFFREKSQETWYARGMDPFEAYQLEVLRKDLELSTRTRYLRVATSFQHWLGERMPSGNLAQDLLADLRRQGYRQRSIILYYHVLRQILAVHGENLTLRLRKPHDLPKWYDQGDIERLLAQAETGVGGQKPWQGERNYALILVLRDAGLRRGEGVRLTVHDVDFSRRLPKLTGKGAKDRVTPMTQRLLVASAALTLRPSVA